MADTQSRPPVVLVHGAFADASGFGGVIRELAADGVSTLAPALRPRSCVPGSLIGRGARSRKLRRAGGPSEWGMLKYMNGEPALGGRPGWVRDVAVPDDLGELRGPMTGRVRLPLRLYWSGPAPEQVEWDMSRQSRRARLYELVLREGTPADVRQLVDGSELVRLWDSLWLPPHVSAAWQPLIDAARPAA